MDDFYDITNDKPNYNDYERSSMDCPISSSNIGFKLLKKMGWTEGKGLGPELEGRVDPIRINLKEDFWGLGKDEEMKSYDQMVTSKPKATQGEIIANETEDERKIREEKVKQEEELKKELKAINSVFYCSLCNKQYSKISEYEQHLDSYDHNHKKRFMEMRKTEQLNNKKRDGEKKRLKEQKRYEKEMQQLTAFANKQQGIIGSVMTPTTNSIDLEKGIRTIHHGKDQDPNKSNSGGGGGWVNSFSSAEEPASITKEIRSSGTPGWKNSFGSVEDEKGSSNLNNNNNSNTSGGGWATVESEPPKNSGIKFSLGMKRAANATTTPSSTSTTTTTTTTNKPTIGFSLGKKPKTAPIKFKFNK